MVQNGDGAKEVTPEALRRSVKITPEALEGVMPSVDTSLLFFAANAADEVTPWGVPGRTKQRDRELRVFYPTENVFMGALGTVVARNMGFSWKLDGPPRTVKRIKDILDNSDQGRGWHSLISKLSIDLYTQDNGAFIEIVRQGKTADSPVLMLNHLDSYRCWHTGDPMKPVIYQDQRNSYHLLDWWNVIPLAELPAPVEGLPGLQFCALTRLLRAAQIIRNINVYTDEKTGGRNVRAIHMIKGLTATQIQDALIAYRAAANAQGLQRYINPLIVGSVDPKADVGHDTLELAGYPDNYNEEVMFKHYIAQIAMAFLSDYSEFAPLPGGNLGSSAQSQIMHLKTQGKGPGLFMKLMTFALNFHVLPEGVEFEYAEQDPEAERAIAEVRKMRADTRAVQIMSTEITPEASRQMAVDAGDISAEVYEAYLKGTDVTEDVTVDDETNKDPAKQKPVKKLPEPEEPPTAETPAEEKPEEKPKAGAKYSEDQARDESGRWTDEGGGGSDSDGGRGGGSADSATLADPREKLADNDPRRSVGADEAGKALKIEELVGRLGRTGFDSESLYDKVGGAPGKYQTDRLMQDLSIRTEFRAANAGVASVPEGQQPVAIVMTGLPGSGKSTALGDTDHPNAVLRAEFGIKKEDFVVLDPDQFKDRLYEKSMQVPSDALPTEDKPFLETLRNNEKGALVHEESSHLAKMAGKDAIADRKNIVWDITGSSKESLLSERNGRIRELKQAGYRVVLINMDVSRETAAQRALERWERGGRYVNITHVLGAAPENGAHQSKNTEIYHDTKHAADEYIQIDESGKVVDHGFGDARDRYPD